MNSIELNTERLLIRERLSDDAKEVSQYNQDKDFWQYTTIPVVPPTLESTQEFINDCIEKNNADPRLFYGFSIVKKSPNKIIGEISLIIKDAKAKKAMFSYGLSPYFHGKGYMTEALEEVIKFGFNDLCLKRIYAYCYPKNKGSSCVMEKCGMKCEGTLRANSFVRGEYCDDIYYGILDTDYKKQKG